jgi:hypothetical protein
LVRLGKAVKADEPEIDLIPKFVAVMRWSLTFRNLEYLGVGGYTKT